MSQALLLAVRIGSRMGCCIKTEYSVRVPEKTVLILVRNFLYMHSTLPRIATTAVCIACQSMLCRPSHLSEISVGCYCAICQSLDYPLEDMGSFALGIIRSDNDDYRASVVLERSRRYIIRNRPEIRDTRFAILETRAFIASTQFSIYDTPSPHAEVCRFRLLSRLHLCD
jgi:hypothetical protein